MYEGHVFLCDSESINSCIRRKSFTSTGENLQVVSQLDVGSIIFLYNMDSNTVVGPFTATGSAESGMKPGAWRDFTENRTNAGIRVGWENLHELKNAREKFSFLKDINVCKLSHFQTQDLLDALNDAPLFNLNQA